MLMPFKPKKEEPGPPGKKRGRPRKSPETPAVKPPRSEQTRMRGKGRPKSERLLEAMERFNAITLRVFEKMGGEQMLIDELMKEDGNWRRQFLKELFSINKKYYDVLIARMRIEAEKTIAGQAAEGHRGNVIFIIKGLYDEPAIDVTPPKPVNGPRELEIKGLDDGEELEQEEEDTTEPE
jgi:hypothetical protein